MTEPRMVFSPNIYWSRMHDTILEMDSENNEVIDGKYLKVSLEVTKITSV